MAWLYLIFAGLCECGFAFCMAKMKETSNLEFYLWIVEFVMFLGASMLLLAKASQTIPIGTAYPVWTSIGAVGTVLLGIFFFHEPISFWRIFFICTLIISIIGLEKAG